MRALLPPNGSVSSSALMFGCLTSDRRRLVVQCHVRLFGQPHHRIGGRERFLNGRQQPLRFDREDVVGRSDRERASWPPRCEAVLQFSANVLIYLERFSASFTAKSLQ